MIEHILDPMNELVAAAPQLAFLGRGRCAGKNKDGHAAFGGIVNGAAERLGATFDMHHDGLRPSRDLGEAVSGSESHHLVRTGDDLRIAAVAGRLRSQRLDEGGVIAAEVGEYVLDSGFAHRLEQCGACRLHDLPVCVAALGADCPRSPS